MTTGAQSPRSRRLPRWAAISGAVVAPVLLAAACGSSHNSNAIGVAKSLPASRADTASAQTVTSNEFGAVHAPAGGAVGAPAPDQLAPADRGAPKSAAATTSVDPLAGRDLVFTAGLTLRVKDIEHTATSIANIADGLGGYISDEQLDANQIGIRGGAGTVTIRVPQKSFNTALGQLGHLGKQLNLTRSVNDVTDETIDVSSRLATQKSSIARIRTLMSHANDLGQIISLESELTQRESQLESLEHRLHALNREVALSTITVDLQLNATVHHHHKTHHHGFVGGLYSGWDAFADVVSGLLTAIGAALPFIGALIVLIAVATMLRRRRVSAP
jgi:uncharacterized protein DUF4349